MLWDFLKFFRFGEFTLTMPWRWQAGARSWWRRRLIVLSLWLNKLQNIKCHKIPLPLGRRKNCFLFRKRLLFIRIRFAQITSKSPCSLLRKENGKIIPRLTSSGWIIASRGCEWPPMWKTLRRHHWALITRAYYPRIRKSTFHFDVGQSAQCECKNNKQIWLQQSWGKHEGLRVLVKGDINWLNNFLLCVPPYILLLHPAQSVAISFPKSLSLCSQAQRIRSDQGREEADYFAPSHLIRTEVELAVWSTLINIHSDQPTICWLNVSPTRAFYTQTIIRFQS